MVNGNDEVGPGDESERVDGDGGVRMITEANVAVLVHNCRQLRRIDFDFGDTAHWNQSAVCFLFSSGFR